MGKLTSLSIVFLVVFFSENLFAATGISPSWPTDIISHVNYSNSTYIGFFVALVIALIVLMVVLSK